MLKHERVAGVRLQVSSKPARFPRSTNVTATRNHKLTTQSHDLYLAFELGEDAWKLAFTIGIAQKPSQRCMPGPRSTSAPAGDRQGQEAIWPA